VPRKNGGDGPRIGPLTMLIKPPSSKGVWQQFNSNHVDEEDISFHVIDFFNWRLNFWRDYSLYRVRIDRWKGHEDKVGFEALIEVIMVDVLCDTSLLP
jgi:hypothetical protein